jgi:hypothetical protein
MIIIMRQQDDTAVIIFGNMNPNSVSTWLDDHDRTCARREGEDLELTQLDGAHFFSVFVERSRCSACVAQ